jgi:hypothetical protein
MGAGGAAIGGFLSGAFDGATGAGGATVGASGDTVEGMLASQGGAEFAPTAFESGSLGGATGAADAASGASTYGLGDMSSPTGTPLDTPATPAPTGGGDLATSAVNGASDSNGFSLSSLTDPGAPINPGVPAGSNDYSLQNIASNSPQTTQTSLAESAYGNPTTSTPTSIGDTNGGVTPAPISNLDNAGAATTPDTGDGGGFNSSAHSVNPPDGTTSANVLSSQLPDETLQRGGLAGLWDTAKGAWNDNMPKGSFQKILGGGVDYLQKAYDAHKLDRINKGMKPLTFDEYKQQYAPGEANRYAAASQQMAQSGHTGTLPILMANMNRDAQAGYRSYLPGAQQQHLTNTAAIQNARQGAVKPLFSSIASLNWGNA